MKRVAWFVIAGVLVVAASAGVSFLTGTIWTGFFTAFVVGVIYLTILDRTFIHSLEKPAHKLVIRVLIIALVLVQFYAAYMSYDRSQFLQSNLAETRSNIDEGVSRLHTQQVFLETLKHYYSQPEEAGATIASSFRDVMENRLHADGSVDFSEPGVNRDIHFMYEIISPDEVMITASAKISLGENPEFMNVSNETGKYQAVATLTPNGIDYEREN